MRDNLLKWFVYLLITAGMLKMGWVEPLSYRFMSVEEIAAKERNLLPPPTPKPGSQMGQWRPNGTSLDRGPYQRVDGIVVYTDRFDPKKTGTATESGVRPNTSYLP